MAVQHLRKINAKM